MFWVFGTFIRNIIFHSLSLIKAQILEGKRSLSIGIILICQQNATHYKLSHGQGKFLLLSSHLVCRLCSRSKGVSNCGCCRLVCTLCSCSSRTMISTVTCHLFSFQIFAVLPVSSIIEMTPLQLIYHARATDDLPPSPPLPCPTLVSRHLWCPRQKEGLDERRGRVIDMIGDCLKPQRVQIG